MPTLLQAQQQLEIARATHKRSPSPTTAAAVTRAYDDLIEAYAAHPNMAAQLAEAVKAKVIHREKYEKVTTETPDKDSEQEQVPETGQPGSDEPPATEDSARGERPAMPQPKGPKRASGAAAPPREDEQAVRGAYKEATGKYTRVLRGQGIDAYGAKFGPDALLKACRLAFGVETVGEVFGALASIPEQRAAHADLETRLAKLEGARVTDEIEALVGKAKLEGRTRGTDDRKELRAFGREFGMKALQRRIADRPAKRTGAQGYHEPSDGTDGNRGPTPETEMSNEEIAASHERVTRGMTAEEKAIYLEEFNRLHSKKRAAAPAV